MDVKEGAVELELEKKYGNYVSGTATYNLSWAYGKEQSVGILFRFMALQRKVQPITQTIFLGS